MFHAYFLPIYSIAHREIVRFLRQPTRIIGAFGTPLLLWSLLGSGIGSSFQAPHASHLPFLHFFLPGAMLFLVLFTSIFSAISIITDRNEGFMQSVISAPIPRLAIVLGKVFGAVLLAVVQATLLGMVSYLGGFPWTFQMILPALFVLTLSALFLACLGFATAWPMDSVQGYHGVMNLILMPMWVLSGGLFPPEGASPILQFIMHANPLHYAIAALRHVMLPETQPWPSWSSCILILTVIDALMLGLCLWISQRPVKK
ncbi:MAG: ABC transporter permease [Methylacidiphilales bacterium]|nr:ABC transporter permease [Candidatus Methylacidiphilales bacterium]MDW8349980.1 ABC transporter permease [Verrucomicrobiae bacterium]